MIYQVLQDVEFETPEGTITLTPGQAVKFSEEEARPLIEEEIISPIEKEPYHIYSSLLDACFWMVPTDKDMKALRDKGITEPIYTADEIGHLKGVDRESLKVVHKVKELFEGSKVWH